MELGSFGLNLEALLEESGLLIRTGLPGLYARTADFERIATGLSSFITHESRDAGAELLRFPPVIDQGTLERNGYFIGFPHLAGCVHSFVGSPFDHKRLLSKLIADAPTGEEFVPTGCALTPAACYPVYRLIAARGALPEGGVTVDVESYCYRHEPSDDPTRMQSFRMREFVRIGAPDQVRQFREAWLARADGLMVSLGLSGHISVAHDPFFGSGGDLLAARQEAEGLKFEMLIPIGSAAPRTACMSFNSHLTHFTAAWDLRMDDGTLAHSACVGFGVERLVLALIAAHGRRIDDWPASLRQTLWSRL
jgi:seryl-tRNA synthetase